MISGRILGVDFGERRVGFAVSDPTGMIASAREVVTVESPGHAANESARMARECGAVQIVVGLPVNMDGSHGPAAQKAKDFAGMLRGKVQIPVVMWDERLSTKSAHDAMLEAGVRGEKRRGIVDKVAAQIFLQNYLDANAFQQEDSSL